MRPLFSKSLVSVAFSAVLAAGWLLSAPPVRGASGFGKELDVAQGYAFKQDEHKAFGYINAWSLGDNDIAPDIKVVDPTSLAQVGSGAGSTAGGAGNTAIFNKPVVAVLQTVAWDTTPSGNITIAARISPSNQQKLAMLTMQSLKKVVMNISFVTYEYDLVNQTYFTGLQSLTGTAPAGIKPTKSTNNIYALLGTGTGNTAGILVGAKAEADPAGIRNFSLKLVLAPPVAAAPQQIQVQTSSKVKLVSPWGLPQK